MIHYEIPSDSQHLLQINQFNVNQMDEMGISCLEYIAEYSTVSFSNLLIILLLLVYKYS